MSKRAGQSKRQLRSDNRRSSSSNVVEFAPTHDHMPIKESPRIQRLECQSEAQHNYLTLMQSKTLTLGEGPAGTGKSYVAASYAAQQLMDRRIDKIIITRPIVEAMGNGKGLGFLPGTKEEKSDPYFAPIKRILAGWFGASHLENMIKNDRVEFAVMEYVRGCTFDNCFVLVDEAQNTTPAQMKLILTRIGKHCTVVVNGDSDQKDIKGLSGLEDAVNRLTKIHDVGHLRFEDDDIVRSGFCKEVLKAYRTS
jgi:phosphate starvation-inducible PhoH-like protein